MPRAALKQLAQDGATDGQALVWDNATGVWIPATLGIFGTAFDYSEDDTESQTTSVAYVQKFRLTTGTLPAGDYRVGFQFELHTSSAAKSVYARVQVDDTTTIRAVESRDIYYDAHCGFKKLALSNATHTIDIDYYAAAGATAYIKSCRVEIWRVG